MGSVWAGRHLALDVPIAIKFMGPSASDAGVARARFAREAKAAAALRSPHVVQIIDYDASGAEPYIVMELLEGEDLARRLGRRGRLPLREVSGIVGQIASGLVLAHQAGIVHRDLKPGNVFITSVGRQEVVKILDFGVAKETKLDGVDAQTTTGAVIGSPSYMSPEQARGGKVDARSDLWSLAVVVFQAVTGKRPFDGANLGDVLVRICTDALPVATDLAPDLPREVDGFFERALCRSPDGRFQDAPSFAAALAAVAERTPAASAAATDAGALAARDEPTGSIAAGRAEPARTTEATATVRKRSIQLAPTIEVPRLARDASVAAHGDGADPRSREPADAPSSTTAGLATITGRADRDRPRGDRRGIVWGLGGAAVVAGLWLATQSGLFSGRAPPGAEAREQPGPSSTAAAATSTATTIAPAAPSAAPLLTADTTPNAISSEAPAAASSAAPAPPPAALPGRPRARPRPSGATPPAGAAVDPKFGLPVGSP
jgi:serine/threonine-protein kinase